ncbi:MAG: hypothetical protein J6K62_02530 [Clostridia bacterium]|nr:hypothetical protein [Clostridia bacterium]
MNPVVKRILAIAAAALLLVYVGVQGYLILVSPLETETIVRATGYQTVETTGVVYRTETVIKDKPEGYLFYTIQNGGRVSRGGTIAEVYLSEGDALRQQKLDLLDDEIKVLESINAQGTSNRVNLSTINQQINEVWLSIATEAQSLTFHEMNALHTRLLELLNKKQLTIGRVENFNERLTALRTERKELAGTFQPAESSVSSPAAGYFISQLDGYETVCVADDVTQLTTAEIHKVIEHQPRVEQTGIGKIVGDYEWYLACTVPLSKAAALKVGGQLEVKMPFVSGDAIPMTLAAINKSADDTAALIFKCTNMSQELSTIRVEQIEIRLQEYNGIRIPDDAIHFNEKQEPGVYVQVGNVLAFRRIRVLHHDEKNKISVCEMLEDKTYAKLYDKMVIKGEDLYDGKLVK